MFTHRFWRRLIILASGLFLGSLVLGGILLSNSASTQATAQALSKGATQQCSTATLKGTYVWGYYNYHITGSTQVQSASGGVATYDGRGHDSAVFSHHSADGKMTHFVHYTGTYTVHSDCTVTETDTDQTGAVAHYDEFLTPDGSLLTFVETDPGFVAAGVLSRGTDK